MEVLRDALNSKEIDNNEDLLDTLSSLNSSRVPRSVDELRTLVTELARRDIFMGTTYILKAWGDVFAQQKIITSSDELSKIYENGTPTSKKILKLLHADPQIDREKDAFSYLKKFVRTLKKENISLFMRYATGSDMMCVEKISVAFNNLTGIERRIVAHTCGAVLDVPATYDSFPEFKEEFLALLKSGYWGMDFA
eukprot:gene2135-2423_t